MRPDKKPAVKRDVKIFMGFLAAAVLFYFLLKDLDFKLFADYVSKGNKLLILLGILVYLSSFAVRGLRWKILLRHLGDFKLKELGALTLAGYAINNILPVRIGEFARAWIGGKRNGVSRTSFFASIFVERTFDGLTIAIILSITLFFYPFPENVKSLALAASLFFALVFFFIMFSAFSSKPLELIRFLKKKLPRFLNVVFDLAEKFLNGAGSLRSFKEIAEVSILSFLVWGFELSVYLLISFAFDVYIPFAGYLFMLCAANLGMLAAPTPGGLGVFQGAILFALKSFKILYEKRMAVAIILHVSQIIPVTIIGFIWLYVNQISVSAISRENDRENG